MRTNFILVDLENVQPESLETLNHEHFRVIIFVGATQTKLSVDLVLALQQFGSRGQYIRMSGSGHNSLDFHIAFYIGQFAQEHPGAFFHIISKDAGFDPLIQHLKQRNILASRVAQITDLSIFKTAACRTVDERVQLVIDRLSIAKAPRPRTTKTLLSTINAHFQKSLNNEDTQAIISGLVKRKFITLTGDKVVYNVPLPTVA